MTIFKRVAASLIGAALLSAIFSACAIGDAANGSAPEEETPKGGYIETDITPPDVNASPREVWVREDGGIDYWGTVDEGNHQYRQVLYHSADNGATWQQTDLSWASALDGNLTQLSVTEEGNCFAVTQTDNDFAVWQVKGGSPTRITLGALKEYEGTDLHILPSQLKAVGEDSFFLYCSFYHVNAVSGDVAAGESATTGEGTTANGSTTTNGGSTANAAGYSFAIGSVSGDGDTPTELAGVFNTKGELVKKFDNLQGVRNVTINKNELFYSDFSGKVQAVDLTSGSLLPEYGYGSSNSATGVDFSDLRSFQAVDVDDSGNYYLASNKGIQRMVPGGSLIETLLEGDMFSFGTPTCAVINLNYTKTGGFIVSVQQPDGSGKLYRYDYDASISAVPEHELTVWSLKESPTVRAAISAFQKQNRDTRVNYEIALTGEETAAGVQDVLRSLNTELLAGKGPDVIMLDGMDYKSYQEKGVLADLSKLLDTAALYENVIKPFSGGDGLFVLPARFSIPLIFGDKKGLDTLKSMQDIVSAVEKGAEPTPLDFSSGEFNKPLPEEKRPAFTFSDLRSAFNFFYNTSEPAIIDKSKGLQQEALKTLLLAVKTVSDKNKLATSQPGLTNSVSISAAGSGTNGIVTAIDQGIVDFSMGRATFAATSLSTLDLFRFAGGQAPAQPDAIPTPGLNAGSYQPSALAGINANSKMQQEAAAFLNAMLADEVQGFALGDGLPVSKSGMAQLIAAYNKTSEENQMPKFTISMENLIAKLTTPVTPDSVVTDIVYAAAERFCKGETTVEDAIKAIVSGTEIYLAEKQ